MAVCEENNESMTNELAEKNIDFLKKIQEIRQKIGFGVWGAVFIVNIFERIAQELRRIILLHFRLLTFMFHFRKLFVFRVSGPSGRDHDSQHQYH